MTATPEPWTSFLVALDDRLDQPVGRVKRMSFKKHLK
jgi:hypothetical protein